MRVKFNAGQAMSPLSGVADWRHSLSALLKSGFIQTFQPFFGARGSQFWEFCEFCEFWINHLRSRLELSYVMVHKTHTAKVKKLRRHLGGKR